MTEGKHTQGQLEACGNLIRTAFAHGDPDKRGWLLAECAIGSVPGIANAERFVLCWNAHDELVSALAAYVREHENLLKGFSREPMLMANAERAILKAAGEVK